jgi:proteic killer suppression protein
MLVDFKDENLRLVETSLAADCGHGQAITKMFRRRMQSIRAALDERDFYAQKSFHFEKLQGNRDHQRSMK